MKTREIHIEEHIMLAVLSQGDVTDSLRRINCVRGIPDEASIVDCKIVQPQFGTYRNLVLTIEGDWEDNAPNPFEVTYSESRP